MANPSVYIAGVGISHLKARVSDSSVQGITIAAATKALLDAGITYSDVNHSVSCFLDDQLRVPRRTLASFGKTGAPISDVECHSGLFVASQCIRSGSADCVLVIGFDQEEKKGAIWNSRGKVAAVGIVLVSHVFLTTHPYLKDSSAIIRGSKLASPVHSRTSKSTSETLSTKLAIQGALQQALLAPDDIQIVELRHGSNASVQHALGELRVSEDGHASPISNPFIGNTGLAGLCELVWQLRGWTGERTVPRARNCLQYTLDQEGFAYVTIIGRADGKATPKWEEIEHLRDGRERLGYNPAFENRAVTYEDWLAVKARDEFVNPKVAKQLSLPLKGGDRAALARL